ncbi:MAG: hypothetical protein LBG97_01970, partial [Coriobacteriales bacterium]|nr:hypothetical protein [Coriobacteriales bacterium]
MKQFNSLQTETKISFFVSFVLLLAEVFLVAIGVASFSWDVLDTDTELTVIMIATMQLPPVIYYFLVRFMWRDALVYMHDSDIIGITLKKLNSRKHLSRKFIIFSGFIAIRFFLVIIVFLIINRGMNAIL